MIIRKNNLRIEKKENMRGGIGSPEVIHISEKDILGSNSRMYSKIIMKPGDLIGYHQHVGEQEIFYFLSGEGMVKDNQTESKIGPGDVVITPDGSFHSIENTGLKDLEFMALILSTN
jgi:mannose-6-phosphate isomerase-like protein (cupin superfamily)